MMIISTKQMRMTETEAAYQSNNCSQYIPPYKNRETFIGMASGYREFVKILPVLWTSLKRTTIGSRSRVSPSLSTFGSADIRRAKPKWWLRAGQTGIEMLRKYWVGLMLRLWNQYNFGLRSYRVQGKIASGKKWSPKIVETATFRSLQDMWWTLRMDLRSPQMRLAIQ